MTITITSGSVVAVCAVLSLLAAAAVGAVDALIAKHIRRLNGYYIRSAGSEITGHDIERRLNAVEDRL